MMLLEPIPIRPKTKLPTKPPTIPSMMFLRSPPSEFMIFPAIKPASAPKRIPIIIFITM